LLGRVTAGDRRIIDLEAMSMGSGVCFIRAVPDGSHQGQR